jgi:hypothetical protein
MNTIEKCYQLLDTCFYSGGLLGLVKLGFRVLVNDECHGFQC